MVTRILKIIIAATIVTALASGSGDAATRNRHTLSPHVIKQEQHGTERWIYIHNNQPSWIWAYFECEKSLTVAPIGIRGNRVSEVRISGIEPEEQCVLNHWIPQIEGRSPQPWTP
jgi:hypothetical protein